MSLWNAVRRSQAAGDRGFNPCFRGCRSGTQRDIVDRAATRAVSILVFVDVALELLATPGRAARSSMFQSLFSWMSLWNAARVADLQRGIESFNPCFRGCRSGTWFPDMLLLIGITFQSLFSWMSLWNPVQIQSIWADLPWVVSF